MKKRLLILVLLVFVAIIGVHQFTYAEEDVPIYTFLDQGETLIDSNLFTQLDDDTVYDQGVIDMSEFELLAQNSTHEMWVNPDGLAMRFVNKTTGYIWSTDVTNIQDYELSGGWRRRIQSSVFVNFVSEENISQETPTLHRRSSENPDISYDTIGTTTTFDLDFTEEEFSFTYSISLIENGFTINMDTSSINEYGTNRITKVTFFEFLGTSYEDDIPGYFFVPSGNGALIRFTESSPINSIYRGRFFSQDIYRDISANNTLLNHPVIGTVNGVNQHGYSSIITSGSEYAEYVYKPPTFQAAFHMHSFSFLLRENYIQNIRGGENLLIYDKDIKDYEINVEYTFLEGDDANYIGMAKAYKSHLIDSGILEPSQNQNSAIGIHIDTLGKEYETGLLFKNNFIMTSTNDLRWIEEDLLENGVQNIQFSMRGFNKGGYSDRAYNNYKFDRQIGSIRDISNMNVLFFYDPTVKYTDSSNIPNNTLLNIAKNPAQRRIQRGDYYKYYTDIDAIYKEYEDAFNTLEGYGGILLDGLSNQINTKEGMTRSEIINLYNEMIPERIPMIQSNYHMLDNTSELYQNLLYHNRSRFYTDSVPFEQIVLSGYMNMYSPYLNFSANINIDMLKLIDFGIYPAFLVTKEPSYLLSKTMSSGFYATYYDNLDEYIYHTYNSVNDALQYTIGEEIVDRDVVARGVVKITYSNDVIIYVNYTDEIYLSESLVRVDPLDYAVER